MFCAQDQIVDNILNKMLKSSRDEVVTDRETFQEIFRTIDTDGTGYLSVEEMTVANRHSSSFASPYNDL